MELAWKITKKIIKVLALTIGVGIWLIYSVLLAAAKGYK